MKLLKKLTLDNRYSDSIVHFRNGIFRQLLRESHKVICFGGELSALTLSSLMRYCENEGIETEIEVYFAALDKGEFVLSTGREIDIQSMSEWIEIACSTFGTVGDAIFKSIKNNTIKTNIVFRKIDGWLYPYKGKGMLFLDDFKNYIGVTCDLSEVFQNDSVYQSIYFFKSWEESQSDNQNVLSDLISIYDGTNVELEVCDIGKYFVASSNEESKDDARGFIRIPVKLYDYQEEAIRSWQNHNFRGILDMATGSGKTITALAAIDKLYRVKEFKLAVVIVCPYQHLVEQWIQELLKFNIMPIVGFSDPKYGGYEKRLKTKIINYNRRQEDFLCFITTIATFSTDKVQELIEQIDENILLIADEAHYLGTEHIRRLLTDRYDYRLALSATINRQWDETGTRFLISYFGGVAYEYSIERAIEENKLTPYKYYPVFTTLTPEEHERYAEISSELKKYIIYDEAGNSKLSEKAQYLLISRARIVAGSVSKVDALFRYIDRYRTDKHILIYCGATGINAESTDIVSDQRQIEYVSEYLLEKKGIISRKFTADETAEERRMILKEFSEGNSLQALVAIKCLDEGVDVPNTKTAFILASSVNRKEFIQRRGRLLRKAPGKEFAQIYDFVSLPFDLDYVKANNGIISQYDKALVKRELRRIFEYNQLAMNREDNIDDIRELMETYEIIEGGVEDEY